MVKFGILIGSIVTTSALGIAILTSTAFAATDGSYKVTFPASVGDCAGKATEVSIKNGKIKGKVTTTIGVLNLSGRIKADGTFKGSLSKGAASFKGTFTGDSGTGTLSGLGGCRGNIKFQKM